MKLKRVPFRYSYERHIDDLARRQGLPARPAVVYAWNERVHHHQWRASTKFAEESIVKWANDPHDALLQLESRINALKFVLAHRE